MKSVLVLVFVGLFSLLHTTTLLANDVEEQRADASQFYSESKFKKAYKIYFSLAKAGDYYSQNKISQMYAAGKGVGADLAEAYAWSVLAAESGVEGMTEKSDTLLQEADDKLHEVHPVLAEKIRKKRAKDHEIMDLIARYEYRLKNIDFPEGVYSLPGNDEWKLQ